MENLEHLAIKLIIGEFYDIISGLAGQERDWARMRSLFITGATIIPIPASDSNKAPKIMDIESYLERLENVLNQNDFFETWTVKNIEIFENIAAVDSTYEVRYQRDDTKPFRKGVNFIQLYFDESRWKIVSMFWKEKSH